MSESRVLRVLAIDSDTVCLNILIHELQECGYKVSSTTKATEALAMLRKNKDDFDIIITEIMMPDLDGFEFLEIVRLEMNIPVIIVSSDSNTRTVVKGIKYGAQDYFVKPVEVEDLMRLSEYVTKKAEYHDSPSKVASEDIMFKVLSPNETESSQSDSSRKKYKRSSKRTNWTPELHKKFVDAYEQLVVDGDGNVVPTKILKLMNDPSVTRENIASHLQKHRNNLKRLNGVMKEEGKNINIQFQKADVDPIQRMLFDECIDNNNSWQIPNILPQQQNPNFVSSVIAPYTRSSDVFTDRNYQVPAVGSLLQQGQCSLTGHFPNVQNLNDYGRGNLYNGFSISNDIHSQMNVFPKNEQTEFTEDFHRGTIDHQSSFGVIDYDMTGILNQVGRNHNC